MIEMRGKKVMGKVSSGIKTSKQDEIYIVVGNEWDGVSSSTHIV
jgi:hypothetical protein